MMPINPLREIYHCGGCTVYRLTNANRIEEGTWTVPSEIPREHNTCCCRGAAGAFSGRLRQLALMAISKTMPTDTNTEARICGRGVQGVQAVSTPQPGRQNNHKKRFTSYFQRVSRLSRVKNYPSHVQAGARSPTHTRNRCAQQPGQPGHPAILNGKTQLQTFYGMFRCPPSQNGHPGHPGHPELRWSA